MIDIVCVLFDGKGGDLPEFSAGVYSAEWADKLYRGFKRNTEDDFNFICLVDKDYVFFEEGIKPVKLLDPKKDWSVIMEAFRPELGNNKRLIVGLDTIISGNIDDILKFDGECGLITDPYHPQEICNGVGIFSYEVCAELWNEWNDNIEKWKKRSIYDGRISEMQFLKDYIGEDASRLDRINPQQIQSYKCHYRLYNDEFKRQARIIYFHGNPKPQELDKSDEVLKHWI